MDEIGLGGVAAAKRKEVSKVEKVRFGGGLFEVGKRNNRNRLGCCGPY